MKDLDINSLEQALNLLGQVLLDRKQYYEVVAIGGGSLLLLGQIVRPTRDLDLIALVEFGEFISAKPLPKLLIQAIQEVGAAMELGENWMNAEPASLLETGLPPGFKSRMQSRVFGGLTIHFAGRFDQICFKLYASVDQGPESKHFADLKLLEPTEEELQEGKKWCLSQDVSEEFAKTINEALIAMGEMIANP